MFKNKLVNIMLIILIALTIIGVLTLVLFNHFTKNEDPNREPTIDEIIALSVDVNEITTNLVTNDFIRVTFKVQVDNNKAKREFIKRDFQVRNIIIRELSGMRSSDFTGSEGIENLENQIRKKINEYMDDGEVVNVYTTGFVIQ
ncbi:flagellar basal body-associated protein FliL [Anaerobacillus alkalidiazotrophicus]|uniref:Flagellar protein FliL n=1 Tax=Anaerobacillus alkalidiazotrophicus TaxID=472963 RepID=A0A1S2LZH6_9BACI|nr:flagellar basal body-associated protein FliL [Anaerobacillus alkalidiazotrophicus]OIJ17842.1 flagellar basal body-associated protein FliL [Anaerobacillus alkalidiazotrophicus]